MAAEFQRLREQLNACFIGGLLAWVSGSKTLAYYLELYRHIYRRDQSLVSICFSSGEFVYITANAASTWIRWSPISSNLYY